jgi:hypothetical protein
MVWVHTGRHRRAVISVCLLLVVCGVATAGASGHPFSGWTGKSGPFRWQARKVSCGAVNGGPNRIEAHSRWFSSPANGYQRVIFTRQIWNATGQTWKTVASKRRTTKDTHLEGVDTTLHWTQFFPIQKGEKGKRSRDVVAFAWRRDRRGTDRTVLARRVVLASCVVGS